MPQCVVIADDLTGGNATGVLLSGYGYNTFTIVDKENKLLDSAHDCQCIVYSTHSRGFEYQDAYNAVYNATNTFKGDDVMVYAKRIDSTLRGNLGSETDAMIDGLNSDYIAIVVPCFPDAQRITVGGYVIVKGIPLSRTEVADDPKSPINTSLPEELFEKQSKYSVGSIYISDIAKGKDTIIEKLIKLKENGKKIIICDSVTQEDMDTIAEAAIESKIKFIAVDPGVFTSCVVRKLLTTKKKLSTGKVLGVVGSINAVARVQMEELFESQTVLNSYLEVKDILDGEDTKKTEVDRVVNEILDNCENYDVCTITGLSILPERRVSLIPYMEKYKCDIEYLSDIINSAFAECCYRVLKAEKRFKGLYTSGGDITVAVCKRLGVAGIKLKEDVTPLASYGEVISKEFDRLRIITKGGMVGDKYAVDECIKYLKRKVESL